MFLQWNDVDLLVAINLLQSVKAYIQEIREKFNDYEQKTRGRFQILITAKWRNGKESKVKVLPDMVDQKKWYL